MSQWIDYPDVGNLLHMLGEPCNDPDCELHNIQIAIEEEVINPTNFAYWLSGVFAFGKLIEPHVDALVYRDTINKLMNELPIKYPHKEGS